MGDIFGRLDEKVAAWVRLHATRLGKSVSRVLGEFLMVRTRKSPDYEAAMRRYLSKKPVKMKPGNARYPGRKELYDRAALR